ncbi:MAG: serine/threonine protein kinase [Lachnospiraceae bacterium]|jgi:serine/threonine protein kinase|nr:serine/threonine protein kinase [Lachnospiraceae bacterium]
MLKAGQMLAQRYQIQRELGQGGSAKVYLVRDMENGRNRALKEVDVSMARLVSDMADWEAEVIQELNYPYFPRIFEILKTERAEYIVMEYLEGETLGNRLRRLGPQPWLEVQRWGKDLCLMLNYLHMCTPPMIFRDMKPDNVMVQPGGNLRLIDFGAVLKVSIHCAQPLLGTRGYAAPEQFDKAKVVDARTDIYGLGMTLYQLLTGNEPENGICREYYVQGQKRMLPRRLNRILKKCVQENPKERYQNCKELLEALQRGQASI